MNRTLSLLTLTGLLLAPTGCSSTSHRFVLVHGAWMDARGWERLTPLLEAEGHSVRALELPGHGADRTATAALSLAAYTEAVVAALDAEPAPVILVGHSMGGTVISQAAEARPDKVQRLVYLAAYLLPSGQSLYAASQTDTGSKLGEYLLPSADGGTLAVRPGALRAALCSDCSDEDVAALEARVRPEAVAPLGTPVTVSAGAWGRVPRTYVHTTQDRAVGPALQRRLIDAVGVDAVLELEAGHAPFLSQPAALAALLSAL